MAVQSLYDGDVFSMFLLMGFIYNISVSIIITLVTRCYGAIYLVPDQVFTSIGIQSEAGDESQELIMSIEQGAKKASRSVTQFLSIFDTAIRMTNKPPKIKTG